MLISVNARDSYARDLYAMYRRAARRVYGVIDF